MWPLGNLPVFRPRAIFLFSLTSEAVFLGRKKCFKKAATLATKQEKYYYPSSSFFLLLLLLLFLLLDSKLLTSPTSSIQLTRPPGTSPPSCACKYSRKNSSRSLFHAQRGGIYDRGALFNSKQKKTKKREELQKINPKMN